MHQGIPHRRGLTGADGHAYLGETDAQGGHKLDKMAVIQHQVRIRFILVIPGVGTHARKRHGKRGFPAMLLQVIQMDGKCHGLPPPRRKPEQGSYLNAAETALVGAFRAVQPPVEIFLHPCRMQGFIHFPVIGFLIHGQLFRPVADDLRITVVRQRSYLQPQGWNKGMQGVQAFLHIPVGNELGMLPGHQQDAAQPQAVQVAGLLHHFIHRKRGADNGIIPGKTAVLAIIDAFVGQVNGGEQADGPAEMQPRQTPALLRHLLQAGVVNRFQQRHETAYQGSGAIHQTV